MLRITIIEATVLSLFSLRYTKSLILQALPDLFPQKMTGFENIVIVACPLNSIVKDQIDILMSRGILADVLRISENVGTQSLTLFINSSGQPNIVRFRTILLQVYGVGSV